MNTYTLELPDGKIVSFNSKTTYPCAIAMLHSDESDWFFAGKAGSYELAEKAANAWVSKVTKSSRGSVTAQFKIVEVRSF